MTKFTHSQAKAEWDSRMGEAVRCLLNLNSKAGAWLWFWDTVREMDRADVCAGKIVHHMLISKLKDYTEYDTDES